MANFITDTAETLLLPPEDAVAPAPPEKRWTVFSLQNRLRELTGRPMVLIITDNIGTMVSLKRGDCPTLRLHKMFLNAPDDVVDTMGRWLSGKRIDRDLVQEYINANRSQVRHRPAEGRTRHLTTTGKYHDLLSISNKINELYLQNRSRAPITWGREIIHKRARVFRLGCFDPFSGIITISRRLDRRDIPGYMVEYVVFHEMLHEILGIGERADGRRDIHGHMFKLMEQTYPYYAQAREFEKKKWGGE